MPEFRTPASNEPTQEQVDACAREPIQFSGAVQSFGCLIVLAPDWTVRAASENCVEILGLEPAAMLGRRMIELLPSATVHTLRGKAQTVPPGDDGVRIFDHDLFGDGRRVDIAIHRDNGTYLVEFEPRASSEPNDAMAVAQNLIGRLRQADTVQQMCDIAADGVWAMSGFDRVMVYRFDADFSGIVVSEARAAGTDSYFGHRFPASDIPPQARALYVRNPIRIIGDVDSPVSPIVARATDSDPVDLSLAVTRAVSPIHLQYLRNMRVGASMSVSIIPDGALWGLIACHHPSPNHVDYETRSAIELLCRFLSSEIGRREEAADRQRAAAANALHDRLAEQMRRGHDPASAPDSLLAAIAGVIEADGIAICDAGVIRTAGLTPEAAELAALFDHLRRHHAERIHATDAIGADAPGALAPDSPVAGYLYIPLQTDPVSHAVLFRHEFARNIVWAGRPGKEEMADGRLSPRQSFAAWSEEVRGRSLPWLSGDLRAAEVLRITLLEMILHRSTRGADRQLTRNARQEVAIAELNHRLANVYAIVSGLVGRAAADADDEVRSFANEMTARIGAAARANEMIIGGDGGELSVIGLIYREVEGLSDALTRVEVTGGDVLIPDEHASTVALALHEMVTNSAKHGALSVPEGRLSLSCSVNGRNQPRLDWVETGGPPAGRQTGRSGFGSTLIREAIPHEMGGEVSVERGAEGLRAWFVLPGARWTDAAPPRPVPRGDLAAAHRKGRVAGRVLVVEDNAIIALNAVAALRALGAEDVVVASRLEDALAAIADGPLRFALLDRDLAGISAAPAAEALRAAGVPFIVVSGFVQKEGERDDSTFAGAPSLRKPYSNDTIGRLLVEMGLLDL